MSGLGILAAVATAGLLVVASAGTAHAQSFAFFERVSVAPLKDKGEVVGARIKLTLRPDRSGYDGVRLGIVPGNGGPNQNNRVLASDPKAGLLLYQFSEIKDFKPGEPKEVTLELKYRDAPTLKPGQKFQIVSAWMRGDTASHVYGMTRTGFVTEKSYQLPANASSPPADRRAVNVRRAGATQKPRTPSQRSAKPKKPATARRAAKPARSR